LGHLIYCFALLFRKKLRLTYICSTTSQNINKKMPDTHLLLQQFEAQLLPFLKEEQASVLFSKYLKQIKKEFKKNDFKLKRTIQDKQIARQVLENTISELKIQSENLKHQKNLTEEQTAFKEQLFANVSHELRTPLHGILGMSHLLENSSLNNEQQGYTEIIRSSADNLLVIINDLLNLSKINAGKTFLLNEPFSFDNLLNDLRGVLAFKAKGKGLNLRFVSSTNMPKFLKGDRTRLYQILLNLLNNAIKFTENGTIDLIVVVLQQNETSIDCQFEVKDSGIGINKDKLTAIFGNFTQLNAKKKNSLEGVGLGLNIVKKLIQLMDGEIKVKSTLGQGTTFTVNLTLDLPSTADIEKITTKKSGFDIPVSWQSKKILMIEDTEANLVYAQNLFASGHVTLDVAKDLATAYYKTGQQLYDCILSDIKLPDGNGFELIAKLRGDNSAINQKTPIIVLTASANEKEAKYAKKLNVQSYIGKPFPPQLIINEMKKIFKETPTGVVLNTTPTYQKNKQTPPVEPYFAHLEKSFKNRSKLQIEMFDIFLDQLPIAIAQMGKGLEENDLKVFHYDAHRIKSTINIIGLPKLKPLITKMDEYCYKKINLEQLPELYDQFKIQAAEDIKIILARKEVLLVAN